MQLPQVQSLPKSKRVVLAARLITSTHSNFKGETYVETRKF